MMPQEYKRIIWYDGERIFCIDNIQLTVFIHIQSAVCLLTQTRCSIGNCLSLAISFRRIIRASIKNKTPATSENTAPTKANPKDQDR